MNDVRTLLSRFMRRFGGRAAPPLPSPAPSPIPRKLTDKHTDAMRELLDLEAFKDPKTDELMRGFDQERVHPLIVDFVTEVLREFRRRGIPLRPFEIYRSPQRQGRLKASGVSNAGAMRSPHQYGCAVDLIHQKRLWDGCRKVHWEAMHAVISDIARRRGIKIKWGGHFKVRRKGKLVPFWDPAHYELENWREWREFYENVGPEEYWAYLASLRKSVGGGDWRDARVDRSSANPSGWKLYADPPPS